MPRLKPVINFESYIKEERDEFKGEGANLFSSAISSLQKKWEKIGILRACALPLIKEYGKIFQPERQKELTEEDVLNSGKYVLPIEALFESVFMFGTVLCDEIAQLYIYFYGDVRNVKLKSHRTLSANFLPYAKGMNLKYKPKYPELAKSLETNLCDYRDKQIVHDFNVRKIDTLVYSNTKNDVQFSFGMMYPKETDKFQISMCWGDLHTLLEEYVEMTLEIFKENKSKCKFYKNESSA